MAKSLSRVRLSSDDQGDRDQPDDGRLHVRRARVHEQVGGLEHLVVVAAREAGEGAELREQDRHADAGHEADHHRVGDEAHEAAGAQEAERPA